MTTLIDKLRAAETGSPELSAEVFKEFNPRYKEWIVSVTGRVVSHPHFKQAVPFDDYTQSIDAALTLVPEDCDWDKDDDTIYLYRDRASCREWLSGATHAKTAIAICIAVLEARK